jgi:hypothetical protein
VSASPGGRGRSASPQLQELEEKEWIVRERNIIWLRNGLLHDPSEPLASPNGRAGTINFLRTLPCLDIGRQFATYCLPDAWAAPAEPPASPSEALSEDQESPKRPRRSTEDRCLEPVLRRKSSVASAHHLFQMCETECNVSAALLEKIAPVSESALLKCDINASILIICSRYDICWLFATISTPVSLPQRLSNIVELATRAPCIHPARTTLCQTTTTAKSKLTSALSPFSSGDIRHPISVPTRWSQDSGGGTYVQGGRVFGRA